MLYRPQPDLGTTASACRFRLARWHLLEYGWQSDPNSAADRVDAGARGGAQQCTPTVLLDLDGAEIRQIVDDLLPFRRCAAARSQPVQQLLAQYQRQECAEDVAANGGIGAME